MTILGIDPGSNAGWAVRYEDGRYDSGVWELQPQRTRRFDGGGMRYVRFKKYLAELLDLAKPDQVVFEEVRRHKGVDAAHCYGAIVGHLMAMCEERGIPYTTVRVSDVKKTATGKGNADKEKILAAAREKWPEHEFRSSDEADARFIVEAFLLQ